MFRPPPGTEQQLPTPTVQPSSSTTRKSERENVDLGYSLVSGSNAFVDLQEVDSGKL